MRALHIVIGSGPAGISAAVALLEQKQRVLMIDGGQDLEPERQQQLTVLSKTPVSEWNGPRGAFLREGVTSSAKGIPLKLSYGSDFSYRALPGAPQVEGQHVNSKFSLGKGGFSAVWGSAVMPYRQSDIEDWPIKTEDLAPHYRKVLDYMPVAQQSDDLSRAFPVYRETEAMPLSSQASALLTRLQEKRSALAQAGIEFGRARLAVNLPGSGRPGPCVRCGLCMYGCPYSLIYSTAHTLDTLSANPDFTYAPGYVVQRFEETGDQVFVYATKSDRSIEKFQGSRVFLGAGVLASAPVMLRSLDWYGTTVALKDSQYFLLPMFRFASVPGFLRRDVHTLAQLFLEICDSQLSPYTIHLQTYTYNDLFEGAIRGMIGPAARLFPWSTFLSRLYLFQGYLHSQHSAVTTGVLRKTGTGSDAFELHADAIPETLRIIRDLIRKLGSNAGMTGLRPLSPMLKLGEPGRGFHTGGSFPMSANPEGAASDTLGRVGGLKRVHLVDSSVLPSIPATTITYTVMANAHRIATLAAQA